MTKPRKEHPTPGAVSPALRRRLQSLMATEAEWDARKRFQPYLAVQSERSCPSPIFVVAFTGVDTWKKVALPDGFASLDLPAQLRLAGQAAREHYQAKNGSCGPFGKITGYALARTYDDWVGLGVDGEIVARSIPPVPWGEATLRCQGQVMLRNGKFGDSAAPAEADSDELNGYAPLPPGLRLVCAPPAAEEGVTWSSVLLRHHFGPDAVLSPAPGGTEDEFQRQVAQLVAGGGKAVIVGHGPTAGLALRQAERHPLPTLLFEPALPGATDEGRPVGSGITAQNTLVVHLIRPGAEVSGLAADRLPDAWHRKYTPGRDPETGLPGLLRDIEVFLDRQ